MQEAGTLNIIKNKMEKIGELNFKKFKTEIKIMSKTKKYIEKENISLVSLIPNAWKFYELLLFDAIDEKWDGKPNKKFGKKFIIIHYGITKGRSWNKKQGLKVDGFKEDFKINKKIIFQSGTTLTNLKNSQKSFIVNYAVVKK